MARARPEPMIDFMVVIELQYESLGVDITKEGSRPEYVILVLRRLEAVEV